MCGRSGSSRCVCVCVCLCECVFSLIVVICVPLSNFSSALHQFVPWLGGQTAADAAMPSSSGTRGTRHYALLLASSQGRGQTLSPYSHTTMVQIHKYIQYPKQTQCTSRFNQCFFNAQYLGIAPWSWSLHTLYLFMSISQNWICMPSSFNMVFLYGNSAGKYVLRG